MTRKIEQTYDSSMTGIDMPDDLRAAQTRLHQATAELSALLRSLPWSVEPLDGRPGDEHPHTGAVTGGREPSPGWTGEQRAVVARLRAECLDLSAAVATHPYWAAFTGEALVDARMALKAATRTTSTPRVDVGVVA